ncbi:SEL1-like repeat protein [Roseimaritima ulvae]|uniref:Beta-lactamase HcpC n=1 Tax=Roseimaritima ulvae TaxID=980254 RepID=A0A5B9R0X3_9BACT|nr:SEL1-like repeat protein [Roseimaritima ulvae]QEG43415.1 Putative beta-lactamase HcpC precursor [Roseimaritima ulvae]
MIVSERLSANFLAFLVVVTLHSSSASAQQADIPGQQEYEKAMGLLGDTNKSGNLATAIELLQAASAKGHIASQYEIGVLYHDREMHQQAEKWWMKSAMLGHGMSQYQLAVLYEHGQGGVRRDLKKSLDWYTFAARSGVLEAQLQVASWYAKGIGAEQNYEKSMEWYLQAAKQGSVEAFFSVGQAYYYGYGTEPDSELAIEWFSKAGAKGHVDSMKRLGDIYYRGIGAKINFAKAEEWFGKAAGLGDPQAKRILEKPELFLIGAYSLGSGKQFLEIANRGKTLALGSRKSVQFLDVETEEESSSSFGNSEIVDAEFSMDGRHIVYGTTRSISVNETATGARQAVLNLPNVDTPVGIAVVDENLFYVAGRSGLLYMCREKALTPICDLNELADSDYLVWTGSEIVVAKRQVSISEITASNTGRYLAVDIGITSILVVDTKEKKLFNLEHRSNPTSMCFSNDGRYLLVGEIDGTVTIWDQQSWKPIKQFAIQEESEVRGVAVSGNGKFAATAGEYGVEVWALSGPNPKLVNQSDFRIELSDIAINHKGNIIAVSGAPRQAPLLYARGKIELPELSRFDDLKLGVHASLAFEKKNVTCLVLALRPLEDWCVPILNEIGDNRMQYEIYRRTGKLRIARDTEGVESPWLTDRKFQEAIKRLPPSVAIPLQDDPSQQERYYEEFKRNSKEWQRMTGQVKPGVASLPKIDMSGTWREAFLGLTVVLKKKTDKTYSVVVSDGRRTQQLEGDVFAESSIRCVDRQAGTEYTFAIDGADWKTSTAGKGSRIRFSVINKRSRNPLKGVRTFTLKRQ